MKKTSEYKCMIYPKDTLHVEKYSDDIYEFIINDSGDEELMVDLTKQQVLLLITELQELVRMKV